MWKEAVVLYQILILSRPLWAVDDLSAEITPQNCSLECVQQGRPGCKYCRITRDDVKKTLGVQLFEAFGRIAFLKGFQVSLQALGGFLVGCQLFLFHRNLSLSPSDAQKVYKSDPFPGLPLDSQYAVTVMALPVPEQWPDFYHSKTFSTRSCAEKNGLEQCKRDWYPKHIEVQQKGTTVTVTFNLAPPHLGITSYFSQCYTKGMKKYTDIRPNFARNKTHYTYQLLGLQQGTNYTCQIAANEVDAVRKTFTVHVLQNPHEPPLPLSASVSMSVMLPLVLALAAMFGLLLVTVIRRRHKVQVKKVDINEDIIQYHEESRIQEEVVPLPGKTFSPPRLLICYSGHDGLAHIKAVMHLGAFIQQHMATQVFLDLWDSLAVSEEGSMAWYCRHIQQSNFVLVICSQGLTCRSCPRPPDDYEQIQEADRRQGCESAICSSNADVAIHLIREEVGRAKARGQDLSKYMTAVFEYSDATVIPTELRLVPNYTLMSDLPLLFSHLHGVALHRPGSYLKINQISEDAFKKLPAGEALQLAIYEAGMTLSRRTIPL
ncbi:interleukin-17 receptor D isoform X2 [Thalassophryne amazonica]|uniref:interleukin-17 receptor D isoform X2 n=1 Tax=Thalassophryne amazonica TaxID=390379 RepID=UPI001471A6B8|nr:interleukin-17 receptor D isoform X2 [Thalassophryne amazonica]